MNADTSVDLTDLHDAIVAQIQTRFPAFLLVDTYLDDREELAADELPACFIELDELDTAEGFDPGTEAWAADSRWSARIIIGFRTPRAKLQCRVYAAEFAAWLRELGRWQGQKGGPLQILGAYPDDFNPALDRYEVWRVEWRQILHLGDRNVWLDGPEDPDTPTTVYLGQVTDVGADHVDDYTLVAGGEE